jgi:hypothetical protein
VTSPAVAAVALLAAVAVRGWSGRTLAGHHQERREVPAALALALDTSAATRRAAPEPRAVGVTPRRSPAADSVVGFHLHDQFGRVHDAETYRGRALLLVGAGRAGRAAGTAWVGALRGLQGDSAGAVAIPDVIPVVAVADLRGVPRLLRRMVRGRFPDDRRQPVLLDWDGALARRLGFEPERCTILVVGPDGGVYARTSSAAVDTAAAWALLREAAAFTPSSSLPQSR